MINLDDFILKIDTTLKVLENEMPAIADEIALNAFALIKKRIIDDRKGVKGARYSTKEMLATKEQFIVKGAFKQSKGEETRFHRDKAGKKKAKGGNEKKIVKKGIWIKFPGASKAVPVMVLPGGYKQFREIQGRPGDHVNLSYTGKMWQGTTIVSRVRVGNVWGTVIGGNNKEAQDKLGWMFDKYGDIFVLEPEENKLLSDLYDKRVQSIIDKQFS